MKKQCKIIWLAILVSCLFALNSEAAEPKQAGRFVKNADNTVIDSTTGLMWATTDNGIDTDWNTAKAYCENYSVGNYSDWRLPTLKELGTIFDPTSTKRFQSVPEITLSGCCPWTSDTRRKRARTIFFLGGEINTFSKELTTGFRALPVRNAQ
nr:DUF1566 domain-containing protein [Desulfobulbaceae bacterium]